MRSIRICQDTFYPQGHYLLQLFRNISEDSNIWCERSLENFQFCVSRDSNLDVSVYQGEVKQKSCGTLQLSYGLKRSDQIYKVVCNTEGNSVVLSKSTGTIIVF